MAMAEVQYPGRLLSLLLIVLPLGQTLFVNYTVVPQTGSPAALMGLVTSQVDFTDLQDQLVVGLNTARGLKPPVCGLDAAGWCENVPLLALGRASTCGFTSGTYQTDGPNPLLATCPPCSAGSPPTVLVCWDEPAVHNASSTEGITLEFNHPTVVDDTSAGGKLHNTALVAHGDVQELTANPLEDNLTCPLFLNSTAPDQLGRPDTDGQEDTYDDLWADSVLESATHINNWLIEDSEEDHSEDDSFKDVLSLTIADKAYSYAIAVSDNGTADATSGTNTDVCPLLTYQDHFSSLEEGDYEHGNASDVQVVVDDDHMNGTWEVVYSWPLGLHCSADTSCPQEDQLICPMPVASDGDGLAKHFGDASEEGVLQSNSSSSANISIAELWSPTHHEAGNINTPFLKAHISHTLRSLKISTVWQDASVVPHQSWAQQKAFSNVAGAKDSKFITWGSAEQPQACQRADSLIEYGDEPVPHCFGDRAAIELAGYGDYKFHTWRSAETTQAYRRAESLVQYGDIAGRYRAYQIAFLATDIVAK